VHAPAGDGKGAAAEAALRSGTMWQLPEPFAPPKLWAARRRSAMGNFA
jgi:hypothetical protein